MTKLFEENPEQYFENATERCVELLIEFYNEYLGLSTKQIGMLNDPKCYLDGEDADAELMRIYNIYKNLAYADLFGLLKTAHDMEVKSLLGILTHVIANVIAGKGIYELEEEFAVEK